MLRAPWPGGEKRMIAVVTASWQNRQVKQSAADGGNRRRQKRR